MVGALGASGKFCILRRENQDVRAADVDDVGALPHASEVLEADDVELAGEGPSGEEFLGLIDQDGALLVQGLGADEDVIFVLFFVVDDLGIALMLAVVVAGSEKRLGELLGIAVLAQLGGAGIGRADPVLIAVIACVEEVEIVARADGASRVGSLVVIESVGAKADAGILPAHQIRRGHVIPVFQAVNSAPGAPLIEQVPGPLVAGESVRIA